MNKIIFISIISLITFSACDPNNIHTELNPATEIIQVEGHDFYIRGTLEGEPFALTHSTPREQNAPVNDSETSSGHPFFGTNFNYDELEGNDNDVNLFFGITEIGNDNMLDVVQLGNPSWYNFALPSNSRGEVFVNQLRWKNRSYFSDITADAFAYNNFNITNIELLDNDDALDEKYKDNLYKVEGDFQVVLYDYSEFPYDTLQLVVDEFSAIFYDNSL